jgi:hypothetical protein
MTYVRKNKILKKTMISRFLNAKIAHMIVIAY